MNVESHAKHVPTRQIVYCKVISSALVACLEHFNHLETSIQQCKHLLVCPSFKRTAHRLSKQLGDKTLHPRRQRRTSWNSSPLSLKWLPSRASRLVECIIKGPIAIYWYFPLIPKFRPILLLRLMSKCFRWIKQKCPQFDFAAYGSRQKRKMEPRTLLNLWVVICRKITAHY